MSIEERLEAITQTLELVALESQEQRRSLTETVQGLIETRKTVELLARVAGVHGDRLDEHQQRLDALEKDPPEDPEK